MKLLNHNMKSGPAYARGVTIVELMVALTLSVILLGGVYTVYISSKQSYKIQEGLSRVQENARFAMDFMTQDIRTAGLIGCDSKSGQIAVNNIVDPNAVGLDVDLVTFGNGADGLEGFEQATISQADLTKLGLTASEIIAGTDLFQVKSLTNADCQVIEKNGGGKTASTANLKVQQVCEVAQDEIVLVSDCKNADLFSVTNVVTGQGQDRTIAHGSNRNTTPKLGTVYGPDAEIFRFQNIVYYIGTGASGEQALMRKRLVLGVQQTEEIVDGVQDMQIQYGIDTDNDAVANRYVNADDGLINGDFSRVMSLRIALLMRSTSTAGNVYGNPTDGNVSNKNLAYVDLPFLLTDNDAQISASGSELNPGTGRLVKPFVSVIKLRNRLF